MGGFANVLCYQARTNRCLQRREVARKVRETFKPNGHSTRHELKTRLKDVQFDIVFSSPQQRAIQTAEITTGQKAIIDARLDVFDLGEADLLKKSEVKMAGAVRTLIFIKVLKTLNGYMKRVFHFMKEIEDKYRN